MFFSPTSDGYLFSSNKLDQLLVEANGKLFTEVERLEANRFLNTTPENLIAYLMQLATVETSRVLAGVDATTQAHVNFKRKEKYPHESGFRYGFHQPGDANRELIITALVFHVPS